MDIGTLQGAYEIEDLGTAVLHSAASHIESFSELFDGMAKKTLIGAGIVTAAIGAVVASVTTLGEKGSTILGVEDSFNKLAVAAGSTGEALSGALSEGVRGTIDSFELMQSTTKLLADRVKLTEDDMRTMGAVAREMGKATGTDAAQGLNTLSQAMLTGNTRSLKRFGINVDLIQSEKDFAKTLGTTRDELNAAGVLEAHRIAILEGMRQKLDTLGESQLSFKERIQQANVALGNWFDGLAKSVARSASVNTAFQTMSDSIREALGETSQTVLKTLIGWIDKFADTITAIGPSIIHVVVDIRDRIVSVWNELVAFNDRWQITNNLIAGAKTAWAVLEGAFNLVRIAVQAVIQAWSSMPEWLQRITRTAIEGTIALSAYSVAIAGVSAPVRTLLGTLDLGLNVVSNFTGGILSTILIWPKITGAVNLATAAYSRNLIAIRLSTTGAWLEKLALESVFLAKMTLTAATNLVTGAFTAFSARLGLATAALYLQLTANTVVRAAQTVLAAVVTFTSAAYTGLITRLGLTSVAMGITSATTIVAKIAMEALGFVILGIQAIPLILALTGLVIGLNETRKAIQNLIQAHAEGKSTWEFLSQKDNDNWLRRWLGLSTAIDGAAEAVKKLHKGGSFGTPSEFNPVISPGALAGGAETARLRDEAANAATASPGLLKASTIVEDFTKKVHDLTQSFVSLGAVGGEIDVFTAAFSRLNPELLKNEQVQEALAPQIDKLANAHRALTPRMIEVRDAALATKLAYQAKDAAILESAGVTQGQLDQMKQLGMSEEDIARQFDVTVDALGRRSVALAEANQLQQNMATFSGALVRQEEATAARREAIALSANKAIADSQDDLNDLIRKDTLSTADYQIFQIKRETAQRIAAFSLSGASAQQIKDFNDLQERLSDQRVDALMVDNQALVQNSAVTLQQIADRARNTYEIMAAHPELYSRRTIQHFHEIAIAAEKDADITRTAWDDAFDSMLNTIESLPSLIEGVFAGGGGVLQAIGAVGKKLADAFIKPLMDSLTVAQKRYVGIGSAIGSTFGGAVGGAGGSNVGNIAGAGAGAILGAAGVSGVALAAATAGISIAAVGIYLGIKKILHNNAEWVKLGKGLGRDLGVNVSEELLKEMEKVSKQIGREETTLLFLPKIIDEAGGVASFGVDKAIKKTHDLFSMLERGNLTAKQVGDTFDTLFSQILPEAINKTTGLISLQFKDLIDLAQEFGVESAAMSQFMVDSAAQAAGGIQSFLENATVQTAAGAQAIGATLAGAFGTMRAEDIPIFEVLRQLRPSIDAFNKQLAETGFSGGSAFEQISRFAAIAAGEISGPALSAVEGLSSALVGASNAGFLTQDMFSGLVSEIEAQRNAILATGAASSDVNTVMQRDLQVIWQLVKDQGFAIDDTTQALLDEAEAQGLVGDKFRSAEDRMVRALEHIADKFDELTGSSTRFTDSLNKIPKSIDSDINVHVRGTTEFPPDWQGDFPQPDVTYPEAPIYAAQGARVVDFKPRGTDTIAAMVSPGEEILSPVESAQWRNRDQEIVVIQEWDGKVVTRKVVRAQPGEVKRLRLGRHR